MEIVIMLFVLVGGSIVFSVLKKNKSSGSSLAADNGDDSDNSGCVRKCS